MKDFIYISVEAAKELPGENDFYFTDLGEIYYCASIKEWLHGYNPGGTGKTVFPKYWLKPIPLYELEGEIESLIETYFKEWDNDKGEFIKPSGLQKQRNEACAKTIINHLKAK